MNVWDRTVAAVQGFTFPENDPPLRYHLFEGKLGLPTLPLYLYTLCGAFIWLGVAPPALRLAAHAGADATLHRLLGWWARTLTKYLCIQLEIEGLEHIQPGEQYVVTPLHEGFADVLALLHLPLPMRFVARDELFTWKLLGPYLKATHQIEIRPEDGIASFRRLLRSAGEVFDAGDSLVIFPQGTILGIETDFRRGAFALARVARRPILPIALTGGHRVWEHPYTPRLRFGERMSLRILPPIEVERLLAPNGDEVVRVEVQGALKGAALSGKMAPPRHFVPARDGYWDGYEYRIDPAFEALAADVARHRNAHSS